jgi:hypothetical protein
MRKILMSALAATALLVSSAAFAQTDRGDMDNNRATTPATTNAVADRNDNETGFNPGWFGLAGLIGLLGLMPRDNNYKTYGRTSTTGTTADLNR